MIDERTAHLSLPLPHVQNTLADDVSRIRTALTTLDAEVNSKQATITGAASTITATNLDPSAVVMTDANGKLATNPLVSSAELSYLDGVTSAIQTQLNGKQATITGAASTVVVNNLTPNSVVIADSSGRLAASPTVSSTELSYLDGVTSAIQTQLNGKQSAIIGAASTITTSNLATNAVVITDDNGKITTALSAAELGYLDGVTSAIQTQLNSKQATIAGAISTVTAVNLTPNAVVTTDANGKVSASSTVSTTELGYLNGATSAIQAQLDNKASSAHSHLVSSETELGEGLADDDHALVFNTSAAGNRKSLLSRFWTYISGKLNGAISTVLTANLAANAAVTTDASGKLAASSTVSTTELGYLDGVTSAIQTQLNGKASLSSASFSGAISASVMEIHGGALGAGTEGGQLNIKDGSGVVSFFLDDKPTTIRFFNPEANPKPMDFITGAGAPVRMRIDPSGSIFVARTSDDGTAAKFQVNGGASFNGIISTGAFGSANGARQTWKLGTVYEGTLPVSPNRIVEVEINGAIYYLAARTA